MKTMLFRYLGVGLGGFAGAIARVLVTTFLARFDFRFPLGTFLINLSGSLLLGWLLTLISSRNLSDALRLTVGAGFVGAYTTFSTFTYETNALIDEGTSLKALFYLLASVVLGVLAVRLGILLGRWT